MRTAMKRSACQLLTLFLSAGCAADRQLNVVTWEQFVAEQPGASQRWSDYAPATVKIIEAVDAGAAIEASKSSFAAWCSAHDAVSSPTSQPARSSTTVRGSVISLILRCLFDFAYWYRRVTKSRHPIAVFADEAHIYLNERDSASEAACHSAERIAKEGRKYGVSLTVISQRPREVSSTILSQCNSFLCLRISNPEDQSYVRSLLPDSVRGVASLFATLRRGEGVLLGDSVMMPTRIRIDAPDPKPASDDASFYKQWSTDTVDIDFSKVLHAWRNQEA